MTPAAAIPFLLPSPAMDDSPLVLLALIGGGGYLASLWRADFRASQQGVALPKALPGATPSSPLAIGIGVAGALLLLISQVSGEYKLGIVGEQSTISVLFAVYTLVAAFVEEVIFRGYVVPRSRNPVTVASAVVAASAVFAMLHPFLWSTEGGFHLTFDRAGWFHTAAVFANSVWFYVVRLAPFNPTRSLLPCFAAHGAFNVGVVAVKAAQGHVEGLW